MRTQFSAQQLADPDIAVADKILRTCVHCGFCTATCPTYVLLGDELDSPRGRIALIKDMLEADKPPTADVVKHIDRCLSCLACMTTCPSGVNYMHLIDQARVRVERDYKRPIADRLMRRALAFVLPSPQRMRIAMRLGRLARPLAVLWPQSGSPSPTPSLFARLRAMLEAIPARAPASVGTPSRKVFPAEGTQRGRVLLLQGCAQQVIAPEINEAAIRMLNRHGIEVVLAADEVCCGALTHHLGRENDALIKARTNIDIWLAEAARGGLDAILVTTSGCGSVIKDYGFLLRTDKAHAAKAERVSALARDISEYLQGLDPVGLLASRDAGVSDEARGLVVAYHAACSLQHGQKITGAPKDLLSKNGFVVKDIPEGHLCCGSAGTYNLMQPDIARQLRDRKVANIAALDPDVIVTGNIGCIVQIENGARAAGKPTPVLHTIELLDWATGGPRPDKLDMRRRSERSAPGR